MPCQTKWDLEESVHRYRKKVAESRAGGWIAAVVVVVAVGMAASPSSAVGVAQSGKACLMKLNQRATGCSWLRTVTYGTNLARYKKIHERFEDLRAGGIYDSGSGLERLSTPKRTFWVPEGTVLSDALAEMDWLAEATPKEFPHRGDVVVDLNAGLGVFVSKSLEQGADQVVALQPDARLRECLRRTFRAEIAGGKLVILSERAPLDSLLTRLKLAKVDFVRAIGADVTAGAEATLRTFRPRIMTSRPAVQLPGSYRAACGPCRMENDRLTPVAVIWW
jgi:hypothetical protein